MKNFTGWIDIAKLNINETARYISTDMDMEHFQGDSWHYNKIFKFDTESACILDFGCGIGRNTYEISKEFPKYNVVGYDSKEMIAHTEEYRHIKYGDKQFSLVEFNDNWDDIKMRKFDCIYCSLVLQHINSKELIEYVLDFKQMTHFLYVNGRRFNDELPHRSTWAILEEQGLIPYKFCNESYEIPYLAEGDPNDSFNAYYKL